MSMEENCDNTCQTEGEKTGDPCRPKRTRLKKGLWPKNSKGCQDTKSELRNVYNGLIACGPSGKRRRVPAIVVTARVQRDRALNGDLRAAEFVFKHAKEFGFFDEAFQSSIRDVITREDFLLLSESTREELLTVVRKINAEEETAKKKMN